MRSRLGIRAALCLFAMPAAAPTAAHELILPQTIQADGAGHFAYEVVVVITESAALAWVEVDGGHNTDVPSWIGDGFCIQPVDPGEYRYPMEGNLLDPELDGSIAFAQVMCDGWAGSDTTVIEAPSVDVVPASWGTVKGMYR
jgi:hypothetical protein